MCFREQNEMIFFAALSWFVFVRNFVKNIKNVKLFKAILITFKAI